MIFCDFLGGGVRRFFELQTPRIHPAAVQADHSLRIDLITSSTLLQQLLYSAGEVQQQQTICSLRLLHNLLHQLSSRCFLMRANYKLEIKNSLKLHNAMLTRSDSTASAQQQPSHRVVVVIKYLTSDNKWNNLNKKSSCSCIVIFGACIMHQYKRAWGMNCKLMRFITAGGKERTIKMEYNQSRSFLSST